MILQVGALLVLALVLVALGWVIGTSRARDKALQKEIETQVKAKEAYRHEAATYAAPDRTLGSIAGSLRKQRDE